MIKAISKWSGWAEAGSIFKSRMEMLTGVIMAGAASVAAFSFIPFLTSNVDWKIMGAIAAYLFITGMVGEIVRRHNATDI